jgi:GT2 family glycosyltransferase
MSPEGPAPVVSIVTPSFNQRDFIAATIDSVLAQTYPHVELLVMDGGSTDGTLDVLRAYGDRVRWISEKDDGQADAINKGFARTSGEILGWLNSDDTLEEDAIRIAVEYLSKHPDVAMIYGDANFIDATGNFIRECAHIEPFDAQRLLHYSDFIVQPAAFFRRSAFEAVGGLDASLHFAMDYDLWLKLARRFKIDYVPKVLANYRWLGGNKSAIGGRERIEEVRRVATRHGATRLPAYFCLEEVNLCLEEARRSRSPAPLLRATGIVLSSWRAMKSLCSPTVWRIIRTGKILRAHAPSFPSPAGERVG